MLTKEQKDKIRTCVRVYRKRMEFIPLIDGTESGANLFRSKWTNEDEKLYSEMNNGNDFISRGIVERIVYGSHWGLQSKRI